MKKTCPFCQKSIESSLARHIKTIHGENVLKSSLLEDKRKGLSDAQIGDKYGISSNYLERLITLEFGTNISALTQKKSKITQWEPKNFQLETTTVWSFKNRGNWATHEGRYRGNWSPYIPRNVILRYSQPGDVVLDYFVGGGTTAIEAKLLGRRCIALDINPEALILTQENLRFQFPKGLFDTSEEYFEPEIILGDARNLSFIESNSIDLICAHPPYAAIISYSSAVEGDLSKLDVPDFLSQMKKVASESLRILKPGGMCVFLIGDSRKFKQIVPIGFQTTRIFLDAGFKLQDFVIKRQHNCKTTGFWYSRSIAYNFLLIAHEYLPIFQKPIEKRMTEQPPLWKFKLPRQTTTQIVQKEQQKNLETTTVWIFPQNRFQAEIKRNLVQRFSISDSEFLEVQFKEGDCSLSLDEVTKANVSLVFVHPLENIDNEQKLMSYRDSIRELSEWASQSLQKNRYFVIDTHDVKIDDTFWPLGLLLYEDISEYRNLALKEIVIVVPEETVKVLTGKHLNIVHRYLLIYTHK